VVFLEDRGEDLGRVDAQPGEDLRVGAGDPGRRLPEALAVGVFPDRGEDLPDGPLDPGQVDGVLRRRTSLTSGRQGI